MCRADQNEKSQIFYSQAARLVSVSVLASTLSLLGLRSVAHAWQSPARRFWLAVVVVVVVVVGVAAGVEWATTMTMENRKEEKKK